MSETIKHPAGAADAPPNEIKHLYRSVYGLAKELDDQRRTATNAGDLFASRAQKVRSQLVRHTESLIFQPHTLVGRKAREILWRKGYYDVITHAKRHWSAAAKLARPGSPQSAADKAAARDDIVRLIDEGIRTYKSIVVRMNRYFQLDLRYLVDFGRLLDDDDGDGVNSDATYGAGGGDDDGEQFSLELISYGLETVHAALLSLGDLHRYHIDLQLDWPRRYDRATAANFYYDAFKLNTKVGMAQNQLGTLYSGQPGDLDAVYHYLYSLVCPVPFELSENNVAKVFAANADELRRLDAADAGSSIAVLLVRFKRLAQICFYDLPVVDGELQTLGHRTLCDLRAVLAVRATGGRGHNGQLTADFMFKIVAVLLFGMQRLQQAQSQTMHTLNALLVAMCAELVDAANAAVERLLAGRVEQREAFAEQYGVLYELFDRNVRQNRKAHKESTGAMENGVAGAAETATMRVVEVAVQPAVHLIDKPASLSHSGASGRGGVDSTGDSSPRDVSAVMARIAKMAPKPVVKKPSKLRCRRRRRLTSDESDEESDGSVSSCSDDNSDGSDYEMDSDFSSDESSNGDEEEEKEEVLPFEETVGEHAAIEEKHDVPAAAYHSDSDISIEGEHFVYPNGTDAEPHTPLESMLLQFLKVSDDQPRIVEQPHRDGSPDADNAGNNAVESAAAADLHEKLRYKRRYTKPDPNILVEFAQHDCTLRALKILFDWMQANPQLLTNCYATNPEFVHKIMQLINHLNIDVFTRKVFFDRTMLRTDDVRPDLERLFVERATVPLTEDVLLKDFAELRDGQQQLDFEVPLREHLTDGEEHVLRIFKLVDFGFYLSKTKLFGYRFCARSRMFVATATAVNTAANGRMQNGGQRAANGGRGAMEVRSSGRRRQKRVSKQRRMAKKADSVRNRAANGAMDSYTSNEENEAVMWSKNETASVPRKSYLKNRNQNGNAKPAAAAAAVESLDDDFPALSAVTARSGSVAVSAQNKFEIMGKLWLRNEVKTLESEVSRKPAMHVTPFLVMDAAALIEHATIVKNLIKSKKFVVLIPSAVLSELDGLKKSSEGARNAIRWLESEISKGCRYMRMQRSYETQSIAMLKTPRKLDRDDFNFLQIAQFCNYMQASHADDTLASGGVLTLLTGTDLVLRRSTASPALSYTGIMNAIAVHFEPIAAFYAKYKNK